MSVRIDQLNENGEIVGNYDHEDVVLDKASFEIRLNGLFNLVSLFSKGPTSRIDLNMSDMELKLNPFQYDACMRILSYFNFESQNEISFSKMEEEEKEEKDKEKPKTGWIGGMWNYFSKTDKKIERTSYWIEAGLFIKSLKINLKRYNKEDSPINTENSSPLKKNKFPIAQPFLSVVLDSVGIEIEMKENEQYSVNMGINDVEIIEMEKHNTKLLE